MRRTTEQCRNKDLRRRDLRAHPDADCAPEWNGIDYLEVDATQKILTVYFLGPAPRNLTRANVRIDGGRRERDIHVLDVRNGEQHDPRADSSMQILVDRPGDFSTYTLRLVESTSRGRAGDEPLAHFDQRYAQLDFSFKAGCPTGLDCAPTECAPAELDEPEIDYLAKDYATFRQLILDRLSLIMPDWKERHVPDVGIALVELLAYTGDQLSAYQDAVATEAYLDTARQRISVRRHAKLVDYAVHEGCNARAWVYLETDTDVSLPGAWFLSPTKPRLSWNKPVLGKDDLLEVPLGEYEIFLPLGEPAGRMFYQAHSRIAFYTWGDRQCCLPRGATSATLIDEWGEDAPPPPPPGPTYGKAPAYGDSGGSTQYAVGSGSSATYGAAATGQKPEYGPPKTTPPHAPPRSRKLHLEPGDVLIFEEVRGPVTGVTADADPSHRHVVRLTRVELGVDGLYDQPVVEIEWSVEDALPFSLCLSALGRAPECLYLEDVSVAHGNVVLVDHGRPASPESWEVSPAAEQDTGCYAEGEPIEELVPPSPFRPPPLRDRPVTHAAPFPAPLSVARRQAHLLLRLMAAVHARLEQLWRASRDGCALTAGELAELRTIFGAHEWKQAMSGQASHHDALTRLLQRETRLLASKARRVRALAARARAGYVLGDDQRAELVEMFGEELAARAGIGSAVTFGSATGALLQNPREALPAVALIDAAEESWVPRADLLDSGARDRHFVVETDDDGRAHLRFGDDDRGRAPDPGTALTARYRTGNGVRGNVGAEAISRIVSASGADSGGGMRVRNPLAAQGGTDPESVAEVKLFAPGAFKRELQRAVISDDYARLAERGDAAAIQRAAAALHWTGSWYEARVAIDPRGSEELEDALREAIDTSLHRYRRIGHDLRVLPARYVALDVALTVCVLPHFLRAHVEAELLDLFSNRSLAGGRRGFFHPDNLSFGEGVQLSRLVAVAQGVTGVESVIVTRLQRLFERPDREIENGILPLTAVEVARLDNDPGVPEHGVLELHLRGGR